MVNLETVKLEQYWNVSRLARRLDRTREFVLARIEDGSLAPDALDAGGFPLFRGSRVDAIAAALSSVSLRDFVA